MILYRMVSERNQKFNQVNSQYQSEIKERKKSESQLELIGLLELAHSLKSNPDEQAQSERIELLSRAKRELARFADGPESNELDRWYAYLSCRRLLEALEGKNNALEFDELLNEAYRRIKPLYQTFPESKSYRMEFAWATMANRTRVERTLGPDEAFRELLIAQKTFEQLASDYPTWANPQNYLSTIYGHLSKQYAKKGEFDVAIDFARRGLAVDQMLRNTFPKGHPQSYMRLVLSSINLGSVLCSSGQLNEAEKHFHAAVRYDDDLHDPKQFEEKEIRVNTFMASEKLGSYLAARGKYDEARKLLEKCRLDAERLSKTWKTEVAYRVGLARCYFVFGQVEYLLGDTAEATKWFTKLIDLHRVISKEGSRVELFILELHVPVHGLIDGKDLQSRFDTALRTEIDNWGQLFGLLSLMVARRASNRVRKFSSLARNSDRDQPLGDTPVASSEPSPDDVAALADLVEHLRKVFDAEQWAVVALLMEGHSIRESADKADRTTTFVRTVREKLAAQLKKLTQL